MVDLMNRPGDFLPFILPIAGILLVGAIVYFLRSGDVSVFIAEVERIDGTVDTTFLRQCGVFSRDLKKEMYRLAEHPNPEVRALAHEKIDRWYRYCPGYG